MHTVPGPASGSAAASGSVIATAPPANSHSFAAALRNLAQQSVPVSSNSAIGAEHVQSNDTHRRETGMYECFKISLIISFLLFKLIAVFITYFEILLLRIVLECAC